MGGLVRENFHEVGVEGVFETGSEEVGMSVVSKPDLVLEVLKGKSVVEDVDIGDGRRLTTGEAVTTEAAARAARANEYFMVMD